MAARTAAARSGKQAGADARAKVVVRARARATAKPGAKEPPKPGAKASPKTGANPFTLLVKRILRSIPRGRVATYGQVAALAGNPGAARQVVRILHSSAAADRLPWHRVIRSNGEIALPRLHGYEEQRARLAAEGVEFGFHDRIDLKRFAWKPRGGRASAPASEVWSKRPVGAGGLRKQSAGAGWLGLGPRS
jgi:methylated-DNA-protein-cysteine methyltransferase-like protein